MPLVGLHANGFAEWLANNGYRESTRRDELRVLRRLDRYLQQRGVTKSAAIPRERLQQFAEWHRLRDPRSAGAVRAFERFLDSRALLSKPADRVATRSEVLLDEYTGFLRQVRGVASSTVKQHLVAGKVLLEHVDYDEAPSRLSRLAPSDLEQIVRRAGKRLCRGSLSHLVAHLRGFLRFLAAKGRVRPGLETEIDTPRLYRHEQLPRSLPWATVEAFLRAIDRSTPMGIRDFAIFSLIATYGLRSCEIVKLTLDDVDWRGGVLRVPAPKNRETLTLPLTDAVGSAILRYLRRGRPELATRTLFLRARAPSGTLKPTAVTEAFQAWARRSGLGIPYQGAHCIRHSYAVHLLRRGASLKTIGDLLGHRTAESTCVYLRLATKDLRDVSLALPRSGRRLSRAVIS